MSRQETKGREGVEEKETEEWKGKEEDGERRNKGRWYRASGVCYFTHSGWR